MSAGWVETMAVVNGIVDAPEGWIRIHIERGVELARKGVEYSMFVPAFDMKDGVLDRAVNDFGGKLLQVVRLGDRPTIFYDSTTKSLITKQQIDALGRMLKGLGGTGHLIMQTYMGQIKVPSVYMLTRDQADDLLAMLEKRTRVDKDGRVTIRT